MKIRLLMGRTTHTSNHLSGAILLVLFLAPSFCMADSNIIEVADSISPASGPNIGADVNRDGLVNLTDLAKFADYWLSPCPP